jgi:hypothetical protein
VSHATALSIVLAVALAACDSPTAIVVRISTNIPQGTSLTSVGLSVQRDGTTVPFFTTSYDLRSGQYALPATVAIIPRDPHDSRTVTVIVSGDIVGSQPVSQRARVEFAAGRVELLDMFLASECAGADAQNLCASTETCDVGRRCVAVYRPNLPLYSGAADVTDVPSSVETGTDARETSATSDATDTDDTGGQNDIVDVPLTPDVVDIAHVGDVTDVTDVTDVRDVAVVADASDVLDVADSGCGTIGVPCCGGGMCNSAGPQWAYCSAGTCAACGLNDQPCCPAPATGCNGGMVCGAISGITACCIPVGFGCSAAGAAGCCDGASCVMGTLGPRCA